MLKLWGMQSIPSLPSLSGPFLPRIVAPDQVLPYLKQKDFTRKTFCYAAQGLYKSFGGKGAVMLS